MFESDKEQSAKPKDRRLGDQWSDWTGDSDRQSEIDEKPATFFLLALGVMSIFVLFLFVGWYLVTPRIEQLNPLFPDLIKWSVIGCVVFFSLLILAEGISLSTFNRSLFPYRWIEKPFLFLLPKTVWLGAKFGISRDRVGNSFIKVNNFITKSHVPVLNPERLLILLPRCLTKESRGEIIDKLNGHSFKILTAGGGEEAREAISKYRPMFILALACERDLMSGIKDVAEKIPVLALPNKRPEGPCKNTHVSLGELEDALRFIIERIAKNNN